MTPVEQYKEVADKALADFQAGVISFSEWNLLQSKAANDYHDSK